MSNNGVVNIRGKEYRTVALRVHDFRKEYPKHTIETELAYRDGSKIAVKATIKDSTGRVISTGMAEEDRNAGNINKTSALENAETSAVGRALAFFGLGGTELQIASADEVQRAIAVAPEVEKANKERADLFGKLAESSRNAGIEPGDLLQEVCSILGREIQSRDQLDNTDLKQVIEYIHGRFEQESMAGTDGE